MLEEECLLSTYYMFLTIEFISPAQQLGHCQFLLYRWGLRPRMPGDLGQGNLAQTSWSPFTGCPLHSSPGLAIYFPGISHVPQHDLLK